MTKRTIPFEGLPDTYDADRVSSSIRTALGAIEGHLEAIPDPPAPAATTVAPAGFQNARRLAFTPPSTGTYGGAADPRVVYATAYDGSGLSEGGERQRFRFDVGTLLNPLMRMPVRNFGWVHDQALGYSSSQGYPGIAFGQLVPMIRHDLGRIPERVSWRCSAGPRGPTGQLVQTFGAAAILTVGTKLRCDVDFIPVFGREERDIELALKGLFAFGSGDFAYDDLAGVSPDASFFENPALLRQYSSELVTTDQIFGGLLVATIWGLPTLAGHVMGVDVGSGTSTVDSALAWLRETGSTIPDQMLACDLPGLGKSLYAARLYNATTLAAMLTAGLKVGLTRGTVDFVLE